MDPRGSVGAASTGISSGPACYNEYILPLRFLQWPNYFTERD